MAERSVAKGSSCRRVMATLGDQDTLQRLAIDAAFSLLEEISSLDQTQRDRLKEGGLIRCTYDVYYPEEES